VNYSVKLTVGLIEEVFFNFNKKIILKENEVREEEKKEEMKEAGSQSRKK
jgi:hypothetical protein